MGGLPTLVVFTTVLLIAISGSIIVKDVAVVALPPNNVAPPDVVAYV